MPHARHQQENFPVASRLCPPALRAPILAIYQFARTADDLADGLKHVWVFDVREPENPHDPLAVRIDGCGG